MNFTNYADLRACSNAQADVKGKEFEIHFDLTLFLQVWVESAQVRMFLHKLFFFLARDGQHIEAHSRRDFR